MRSLLVLFFTLMSVCSFAQSKGTLKGSIQDKDMDLEPLPFVSVYDSMNNSVGTTSDFDGNFILKLTPGVHTIVFEFVGYQTVKKQVTIQAGVTQNTTIVMASAADALEAVVLTVSINKESDDALLAVQKEKVEIIESIGAEQLSKAGVSNAAAATAKITGVTKNEASGDVFVRGLGDRYLFTTLNGLPIPSDDVSKKNIDLNLFPTGVIQNVGISKTYTASSYGDQTSGHVNVASKEFSKGSDKIKVSFGTSTNTNVLGVLNDFKATQNINNTSLGFYNSSTSTVSSVSTESWDAESQSLPIDYKFSVSGGHKYDLNNDRDELSFVALLSHGKSFDYKESEEANFSENALKNYYNDAVTFGTKTNTTGMLNVKYNLDKAHEFKYVSLFVNKLSDEFFEGGRNGQGYGQGETEFETGVFVRDQNIKQSRIFVNQLLGKHEIDDKNQTSWAIGLNNINADEPNRIRNQANVLPNSQRFINTVEFSQRKSFQEIIDQEINALVKHNYTLIDEDDKRIRFEGGFNIRSRTRDFTSQFVGVDAGIGVVGGFDNFSETILAGLSDGSFSVEERDVETYEAKLSINAGYVSTDMKFGSLVIGAGLRYENDVIDLIWDTSIRQGNSKKNYNNFLPSLTVKKELNENNNIRVVVSKTTTLPEFKELAPFTYISPTGNITIGNPDLSPSTNYNADLKWEMFPAKGQLISVTGFYKLINNPINSARESGSSGYFTFNNTGDQANVLGLEAETKLDVYKSETLGKINANANLTLMHHEQDLLADFQYNGVTKSGLAGASDYIINAGATYSDEKENPFTTTLSANYSSDKIYALGSPGTDITSTVLFNDEVIEKAIFTLDWVFSKKFNKNLSLSGSVKNILNPDIKKVQDITTVRRGKTTTIVSSYKRGVDISLGAKYTF